jgi:hypothetical protein
MGDIVAAATAMLVCFLSRKDVQVGGTVSSSGTVALLDILFVITPTPLDCFKGLRP